MTFRTILSTACIALLTTTALAHDGVKNPVVMQRMAAMGAIGQNVKTIAGMAKGSVAFDAAAARVAAAAIARHAADIPTLFEHPETDPKSEALPEIWTSWDDFIAKAAALRTAAEDVDTTSPETLGQGLGLLGGACKSCHADYRM